MKKKLEIFEKFSHHSRKASISWKISSKSLVIFEKASDFLLKPPLPRKFLPKAS
jgi:hypothetical protein